MLMAESLNVANDEQETDSSCFQLPPVERNEDIVLLVMLIVMNQCIVRVGHKAEVYNMLIVAGTIEL